MFYAGRENQGVCAAGGAHSAHGDNFVLEYVNPVVTGIQGSSEFIVSGSGFFPNDPLTLRYGLSPEAVVGNETGTANSTAAIDGTFSCVISPPNYPGPEFQSYPIQFDVTVRDEHQDYAQASCQVDAQGEIRNFQKGQSGTGP
jgi:hypothetical protein